jgi:hypothetical protein
MRSYEKNATGSGRLRLYPPILQPQFTLPTVAKPQQVLLDGDRLWALPSTQRIVPPSAGAWLNLARDTGAKDVGALRAIAFEYGPLTIAGATEAGEPLAVWRALIKELGQLGAAWTRDGAAASPVKRQEIALLAAQVQDRLVIEHQQNDGGYASYGAAGFGMITVEMAQWWRLSACTSIWAETTFRRCRYCNCWFTLYGRRADAGYCSERHRVYAAQGVKIPASMGWWGLI